MKKSIVYCIITVVVLTLLSCRKGEDDSSFTLLSRKARLEGKWNFKLGKLTLGVKFPDNNRQEVHRFVFKPTRYTRDVVGKGSHFEGPFSLSLAITKDGHIDFRQQLDSINVHGAGTWDFMAKGKDLKNKEAIFIKLGAIGGYSTYFATFNKSCGSFMYKIKELSNKKLVLIADKELIDLDETGTGIYVESEYTFEQ